jgi:F-type H+-transporting ATPase subunit b
VKKAVLTLSILGAIPLAAHAAEEGVNVIPNNIGLQLWVVATFVVMIVLLGKLAFKPIGEALERRGATIKAQLDEAEKSRAEAKKLMEDYQKQIAEARVEAGKVIEEARQLGEKVRKDVVDKANSEASAIVSRSAEEIVRQKEKGIQDLKDTVASLSVQIAGRIIEKEVNEATHKQLIENLIKDLTKVRKQ